MLEAAAGMHAADGAAAGFRRALLRALLWSALVKLVALLLLWRLCFLGHAPPDPAAVSRQLHLTAPAPGQRNLTDG
jgi:uncharacterized membrane protein